MNLIFVHILILNMYLSLVKYVLSLEKLVVNHDYRKYKVYILKEKNNQIN